MRTSVLRLAAVEAALGLAIVLLSVAAYEAGPLAGDEEFVDALQALPGWLEPAADGIRAVTGTQVVLVFGAILAAWRLYRRRWQEAVMVGLLMVTLAMVQPRWKDVVDRPRPEPAMVDVRSVATSESFPSGHAGSGLMFYTTLALVLSRRRRERLRTYPPAVFAVLLALGLSANSYLGVHWPTDAAGSALGAAALLAPAWTWMYGRAR